MTAHIPRSAHPRAARRGASTAILAFAAALVLLGCNGFASATETRVNGTVLTPSNVAANAPASPAVATTATPASRERVVHLVPPPQGVPPTQPVRVAPPVLSAQAAIVVDDASGAVLFDHQSRLSLPPASLTKIATAALAIDRGKLDAVVTIDFPLDSPALDDATEMGLKGGDRFKLRDLIYGMLLPSGADASLAIVHAISGSEGAYVREMNSFMESLGLFDTRFIDPHGVGGPLHRSTAYDMAMLSRYAMRQPLFAQAARTDEYRAVGSRTITVGNTNPWMFGYRGADGIKSGFTEEAGATLAASATRNGHRVIVVVLNASLRNQDTTALMDWAFDTFCWGDGQLGCAPR